MDKDFVEKYENSDRGMRKMYVWVMLGCGVFAFILGFIICILMISQDSKEILFGSPAEIVTEYSDKIILLNASTKDTNIFKITSGDEESKLNPERVKWTVLDINKSGVGDTIEIPNSLAKDKYLTVLIEYDDNESRIKSLINISTHPNHYDYDRSDDIIRA